MLANVRGAVVYLLRPADIVRAAPLRFLRFDVVAGLTVAIVALPQAIAYGVAAGVGPSMGLYTAIVAPIVAGLWGSSNQVLTGPTNVTALLVFTSLSAFVTPGTPDFLLAAGLTAALAGAAQLVMGLARLGMLVNFISDSLIVGFAAGAGILLAVNESRYLLGLSFTSSSVIETAVREWQGLPQVSLPTLAVGLGTIVLMVAIRRLRPRWPATVIALAAVCVVVFVFGLNNAGVKVIGPFPQSLPPFQPLPIFNLSLVATLAPAALAIAAVGLIQTMSIARSLAIATDQQIDNNQEFVGQGLGNIASGFLSGIPACGSNSCSTMNYQSGARSPIASALAGALVLVFMLLLSPVGAYLPRAALAGVLIVIGVGMVDRAQIVHIWRTSRGEAVIMLATFLGTLFLRIDFAVLGGILMSLAYYILQTSAPKVTPVVPDDDFRHFVYEPERAQCPQLGILDILGDLYFGAASNVERAIRDQRHAHPAQRYLLLRMHSVQRCDITGIRALQSIVRYYRQDGGDVFMVRVQSPVLHFMRSYGFFAYLGADHFLAEDTAIEYLFYHVLDPAVCIYESDVRVFRECQNLPRSVSTIEIALPKSATAVSVPTVAPPLLWRQLHGDTPPLVIDVREPREFQQGHIQGAQLLPLPTLVAEQPPLPRDRPLVFVCRIGRRSTRAAQMYLQNGYTNVAVLEGGMQGWAAARLLEAVG
ncbi:MAG: SulP family inorganic anion transporter [Anaerolineae bacterium]